MVKKFRQVVGLEDEDDVDIVVKTKKVKKIKEDRRRSKTINIPERVPTSTEHIRDRNKRNRIEEELLRACLAEGMQREDILRLLNISDYQLGTIEKRLLANDGQKYLSMTAAHRYYLYALQQEQCIRDLDGFIQSTYDSIKSWNDAAEIYGSPGTARKVLGAVPSNQGAVLAIKAKSELLDRTIKMGQEMGIIDKRAKEVRVSGQLNLAALPTEQLKIELGKKLDAFQALVDKGTLPSTFERMLEKSNDRLLPGRSDEPESVMDTIGYPTEEGPVDGRG